MANLTETLAKGVKIDSFKKQALNWRRTNDELLYIINIQQSRFNDSEESFTLNISIFSTEVYQLCWGKDAPKAPIESDGIFRKRVGFFCKEKESDNWYSLSDSKEIPALVTQITNCITKKILPFLEQIKNKADLYKYLCSIVPSKQDYLYLIQLACLAFLSGDKENALTLLETVSATSKAWKENAERVRSRLSNV